MILNFLKKKIIGERRFLWDTDYTQGTWEYLKDNLEVERYQTVLQAVERYLGEGSILEVGCGEGILQSRMQPGSYNKYMGIDISKVAIRKAAHLCNNTTSYIYSDMEKFKTTEKFDVIMFNESIYYAKNPINLLKRYAHFLKPDGHIIISIYETEENRQLMDTIEAAYQIKEQQVSVNERGAWYCQIYQMQAIIQRQNK